MDDFSEFDCVDCGVNTHYNNEYYMVNHEIWPIGRDAGMLCIGCLETRIGRQLTYKDFPNFPVNSAEMFEQSKRLKKRLKNWKYVYDFV